MKALEISKAPVIWSHSSIASGGTADVDHDRVEGTAVDAQMRPSGLPERVARRTVWAYRVDVGGKCDLNHMP